MSSWLPGADLFSAAKYVLSTAVTYVTVFASPARAVSHPPEEVNSGGLCASSPTDVAVKALKGCSSYMMRFVSDEGTVLDSPEVSGKILRLNSNNREIFKVFLQLLFSFELVL